MDYNLKFYKERFQPKEYFKAYYSELDEDTEFYLKSLHQTFQSGSLDNKKSRLLLEIGCGPVVMFIISASKWSNNIICSDYGEMNLQEVRNWLEGHEEALDWTPFFQCHESLQDRVRQSIRDVIYCDMFSSNPVAPQDIKPDAILTSLCLEGICGNEDDYQRAINNITSILAPGGYLIMQGCLGITFTWLQGEKTVSLLLTETAIRRALKNAGMHVIDWKAMESNCSANELMDHSGCFFVVSEKNDVSVTH